MDMDSIKNAAPSDVNDHLYGSNAFHELQIDADHYDQLIQQEISSIDQSIRENSATSHLREPYELSDRFPVDENTVFCTDEELNAKVKKELAENRAVYKELKDELITNRNNPQQANSGGLPSLLSLLMSDEKVLNRKFNKAKQTRYIDQLVTNTNNLREKHFQFVDTFKVASAHNKNYNELLTKIDSIDNNADLTLQDKLIKYPSLAKAAKLNVAASKALSDCIQDMENTVGNLNMMDAAHLKEVESLRNSMNASIANLKPNNGVPLSPVGNQILEDFQILAPMLDSKHVGTDIETNSQEAQEKNKKAIESFAESIKNMFSNLVSLMNPKDDVTTQSMSPSK